MIRLEVGPNALGVTPHLGTLRELNFGGVSPLHVAPWVDDPVIQSDDGILPVERELAGDFFCAPFGGNDVEGGPNHGWTANASWAEVARDAESVTLRCSRTPMGSTVEKTLRLSASTPVLHQAHRIIGGEGALTVAHHPMVHIEDGARLSFSAKRCAITPDAPLEPGRHVLACPARSEDLAAFPGVNGPVDLTRFPIGAQHEEFVTLVEADLSRPGWTVVLRRAEQDIIVILKDPGVLPVTMLWMSNGGRDYAPWNGTHINVLGIEDGCAAGASGHAGALADNSVRREGVPTVLPLGGTRIIHHLLARLPCPVGWARVEDVHLADDRLTLTGDTGQQVSILCPNPF